MPGGADAAAHRDDDAAAAARRDDDGDRRHLRADEEDSKTPRQRAQTTAERGSEPFGGASRPLTLSERDKWRQMGLLGWGDRLLRSGQAEPRPCSAQSQDKAGRLAFAIWHDLMFAPRQATWTETVTTTMVIGKEQWGRR